MLAWVIVLLAFFVLAVQLFIAIIEFKLTTLAGFVLVPFALFGQTAFLAERVLGNVISSGIKLMVLAIVVGIGSSIFGTLVRPTADITLTQAASTILAAIAVFGLAIFVPGHRRGPDHRRAAARGRRSRGDDCRRRRHRRGRRHAHLRGCAPRRPRLGCGHQGCRVADRHCRRRLPGGRAPRRRPRHRDRSRLARCRVKHGTRPRRLSARARRKAIATPGRPPAPIPDRPAPAPAEAVPPDRRPRGRSAWPAGSA